MGKRNQDVSVCECPTDKKLCNFMRKVLLKLLRKVQEEVHVKTFILYLEYILIRPKTVKP